MILQEAFVGGNKTRSVYRKNVSSPEKGELGKTDKVGHRSLPIFSQLKFFGLRGRCRSRCFTLLLKCLGHTGFPFGLSLSPDMLRILVPKPLHLMLANDRVVR